MTKADEILTIFFLVALLIVGVCLGYGLGEKHLHVTSSIPSVIFVRGHRWDVVENADTDKVLDKAGLYAVTDCTQQAIFIQEGLSSGNERDTLLHELLHAGTCEDGSIHNLYWNSTDEKDHQGIYKISNYLSELLYENPDLVKYLVSR